MTHKTVDVQWHDGTTRTLPADAWVLQQDDVVLRAYEVADGCSHCQDTVGYALLTESWAEETDGEELSPLARAISDAMIDWLGEPRSEQERADWSRDVEQAAGAALLVSGRDTTDAAYADHDTRIHPGGVPERPAEAGVSEPPVVACICGSTSQRSQMADLNRRLTMEGKIVLAPGVFQHDGDPLTEDEKVALDALHFRKIDMADEVHFIRKPDGSFGSSTSREHDHATSKAKRIVHHDADAATAERRRAR